MNEFVWSFNRIWRTIAAISLATAFLVSPGMAGQAKNDAHLDLAALILHSDDLDWLLEEMDLMVEGGSPYGQQYSTSHTSIEEAVRHEVYALGRGGFTLSLLGEQEAEAMLRESGWVRAQSAKLDLPEPGKEGFWSLSVAISIEEFATAEGAETAMSSFDNAEMLEELTLSNSASPIDPPPDVAGANVLAWELVTSRYDGQTDVATLWAQVDNLVVSVALMHGNGYKAPDPAMLAPLIELQLMRLKLAKFYYQPALSNCAPEFQESQATDTRAEYTVLNGKAFALANDTFADLEAAQAKATEIGLIDDYRTNQRLDNTLVGAYDGTMWFRGQIRVFTSEDAAENYLAGTGETLANTAGFSGVEQLDTLPALGDGAALFNYLGTEDNAATIIFVQLDEMVLSIRLGSMMEYQPEAVIELAEAQLARLDDGNCDEPLEIPNSLMANLTTYSREIILGS